MASRESQPRPTRRSRVISGTATSGSSSTSSFRCFLPSASSLRFPRSRAACVASTTAPRARESHERTRSCTASAKQQARSDQREHGARPTRGLGEGAHRCRRRGASTGSGRRGRAGERGGGGGRGGGSEGAAGSEGAGAGAWRRRWWWGQWARGEERGVVDPPWIPWERAVSGLFTFSLRCRRQQFGGSSGAERDEDDASSRGERERDREEMAGCVVRGPHPRGGNWADGRPPAGWGLVFFFFF